MLSLSLVPQIQFLEGVIFLHKFFTKSVISGSKRSKLKNAARKRESGVRNSDPGRLGAGFHAGSVLTPKIQFWEGVVFLHKFFTKSMTYDSKWPKSEKSEFWDFGGPRIKFLEGVVSLYKFFTKSLISGSKCPKSENSKICSCLLVLSLFWARASTSKFCSSQISPILWRMYKGNWHLPKTGF